MNKKLNRQIDEIAEDESLKPADLESYQAELNSLLDNKDPRP